MPLCLSSALDMCGAIAKPGEGAGRGPSPWSLRTGSRGLSQTAGSKNSVSRCYIDSGVFEKNAHRQLSMGGARAPPAPPISMFIRSRRKRFAKVGVFFETTRTPPRRTPPTLKLGPGVGPASTTIMDGHFFRKPRYPSSVCWVLGSLLLLQ